MQSPSLEDLAHALDQTRAAMVYGYDCFRAWEEEPAEELAGA